MEAVLPSEKDRKKDYNNDHAVISMMTDIVMTTIQFIKLREFIFLSLSFNNPSM